MSLPKHTSNLRAAIHWLPARWPGASLLEHRAAQPSGVCHSRLHRPQRPAHPARRRISTKTQIAAEYVEHLGQKPDVSVPTFSTVRHALLKLCVFTEMHKKRALTNEEGSLHPHIERMAVFRPPPVAPPAGLACPPVPHPQGAGRLSPARPGIPQFTNLTG